MSPEQARGEPVDARTDLFSLGVVLYEMATGQLPFPGKRVAEVFDNLLNRVPPAPSELNPLIPAGLERIILACLEKDRKVRIQSASEVRARLQRLKRDTTVASPGSAATASDEAPAGTLRRLLWGIAVATALTAAALRVELLSSEAPSASSGTSAEAYNAYLHGRYFAVRFNEEDLRRAIGYYEKALAFDNAYAPAWAQLSHAYSDLAINLAAIPLDDGMATAHQAAERALALDDTLAAAHAALGRIQRSYEWDWIGAGESFQRALDFEPNNVTVLYEAARLKATLGRFDKALELLRSLEDDPRYAGFLQKMDLVD